jgi:hypothetical protein
MTLGSDASIRFWVQTYNPAYGLEKYNVAVSTTGTNPTNFVMLNDTPLDAPADWTRQSFSLSNYSGHEVYIGINCVSNNQFIFMIDDIEIGSALGMDETPDISGVMIYPNPASDHVFVDFGKKSMSVTNMVLMNETGIILKEIPINRVISDIFSISLSGLAPGIYYLVINSGEGRIVKKVALVN